jgi:hypothetical protein
MLGSEWESLGRDAIVAWKVTAGAVNSVALDGLAIVAVVVADRNLGSRDLGAPPPSIVRSVLLVDANASTAQRNALVAMVRRLAPDLTREVVSVKPVPIAFAREGSELRLSAGDARLDVTTTFEHSPTCGATRWFDPLAASTRVEIGFARSHSWTGAALGAQWSQTDRKSSFVGTFEFAGSTTTTAAK